MELLPDHLQGGPASDMVKARSLEHLRQQSGNMVGWPKKSLQSVGVKKAHCDGQERGRKEIVPWACVGRGPFHSPSKGPAIDSDERSILKGKVVSVAIFCQDDRKTREICNKPGQDFGRWRHKSGDLLGWAARGLELSQLERVWAWGDVLGRVECTRGDGRGGQEGWWGSWVVGRWKVLSFFGGGCAGK